MLVLPFGKTFRSDPRGPLPSHSDCGAAFSAGSPRAGPRSSGFRSAVTVLLQSQDSSGPGAGHLPTLNQPLGWETRSFPGQYWVRV